MLAQSAQRSLDMAAASTLARIRSDQDKVDGRLRPLLHHIEKHLFDPGLDVNQLKRRCGVRDNSIPIQFHAKLGLPPHAYIEDCRLSTACSLLRDTELKVWQIASMLGYSSIQVFSRAFSRWAKTRPTAYRRSSRREAIKAEGKLANAFGATAARAEAPIVIRAAAPAAKTTIAANDETRDLKRALDGELEASQAARLIRRLLNLYPATSLLLERPAAAAEETQRAAVPTFRATYRSQYARTKDTGAVPALADEPIRTVPIAPPPGPDYRRLLTLEEIETARAEAVWDQIKDLPQDEMRTAIQESGDWETNALFEHIRVRSMVDGRDDRKRGVEIAELLFDTPRSFRREKVSSCENARQASAWTWLGNARRLSLDLVGAQVAFQKASESLEDENKALGLHGDLAFACSNLSMYQRRYEDALEHASVSLSHYESLEQPERTGRALAQRSAMHLEVGDFQACAADAKEALSVFQGLGDTHMALVAFSILGRCHARAGELGDAIASVKEARALAAGYSDSEYLLKFEWLEADLSAQAGDLRRSEELYSGVIDAFVEKKRPHDAAFAALELACHQWSDGDDKSVVSTLEGVLPAFERLQMKQDAIAALRLLEQSARRSQLTKAIFDSVRERVAKT